MRLYRAIDWLLRRHRHLVYATYHRDLRIHGKQDLKKNKHMEGWHATNIALHILAASLVYAILRGFFAPLSASLGAVVFAVHPMGTASVSTISGRSSLLCGVLYLAGILGALIGGWWWVLVPVCFALGWVSKQEIIMLPVAIVCTLWIIR